jgi:hypothetical protein
MGQPRASLGIVQPCEVTDPGWAWVTSEEIDQLMLGLVELKERLDAVERDRVADDAELSELAEAYAELSDVEARVEAAEAAVAQRVPSGVRNLHQIPRPRRDRLNLAAL